MTVAAGHVAAPAGNNAEEGRGERAAPLHRVLHFAGTEFLQQVLQL